MEPSPEVLPSLPSRADGEAATLLALGLRVEEPPEPSWPTVDELGRLLPGYAVEGIIGRGAMGLVYRARQQRLDRVVAIKVLSPVLACEPAFAERLAREATTLARLDHPGIVRIHDFDAVQGLFYLVMEHVDGPNLRTLAGSGMQPLEVVHVAMQLCGALQVAHARGIVHRDIKPENILLTGDAQVKLADFGLAKLAPWQRTTALTASHCAVGTPNYMAPEQLRSPESVDTPADIYALGVVLYEVVAGQLPIGRFPPPSAVAAQRIGPVLDAAIMSCLEHDPSRRPTAEALGAQLAAIRTEMLAGGATPERRTSAKLPTTSVGTPSEWAIMRDALTSAHREPSTSPAPKRSTKRRILRVALPVLFGMIPLVALLAAVSDSQEEPPPPGYFEAWPSNVEPDASAALASLASLRDGHDFNCAALLGSKLDVEVGDAPVLGNPNAAVTVVIWSSYDCSWCRRFYASTLPKLFGGYGDELRVVHKHYVTPGNESARRAAIFAEAAGRQGRFWSAHAELFRAGDRVVWNWERLLDLGARLGLDTEMLERDFFNPAVEARVDADLAQADRLCVGGAPAKFINGRFVAVEDPGGQFFEAVVAAELGRPPVTIEAAMGHPVPEAPAESN